MVSTRSAAAKPAAQSVAATKLTASATTKKTKATATATKSTKVRSGRVSKTPPIATTTTTTTTKPAFLFVPYQDINDLETINEHRDLAIPASTLTERFLARYPMYSDANMSAIATGLGSGFATSTDTARVLHQGIAMMQHLDHCFSRSVTIKSWNWLSTQLEAVERRQQATGKPQTSIRRQQGSNELINKIFRPENDNPFIIFLYWTKDPGPPTTKIYECIRREQLQRNSLFRVFPSESETLHETEKFGDIKALNEIAASSPPEFSYRPITCFEHGDPKHNINKCPLKGKRVVMKRTHSSGGDDVELMEGDTAIPRCQNKKGEIWKWFGQENEESFLEFGEFRVFIVAKSAEAAEASPTRGRSGNIIHSVITDWAKDDEPKSDMDVRVVSAHDWRSPHVASLSQQSLHSFALHIYSQLRLREDWKENFESLEIGVRLDIAVGTNSSNEGGRWTGRRYFYVNEITRFYQADFFSQRTLGEPKQQVCYAFAEAIDGFGFER